MGIQERREREKEQRKAAILECALNIFVVKGVDATTMDEIADCAELSKATLYLYFKSKEEIAFNVIGNVLGTFIRYIEEQMSTVCDAVDKIRKTGEAYLKFYMERHGQFVLLNSQGNYSHTDFSAAEFYTVVTEQSNRLWKTICEPIEAATKEGYFRKGTNSMELAMSLWGASNGILNLKSNLEASHKSREIKAPETQYSYMNEKNKLDLDKMLRNIWDSIINSYQK